MPSGAAFVVVQHLDPTHKDALVELLQRASVLPVHQASGGLRVDPEHLYVIPPNKDLSIVHGVLHLLVPAQPRGLRLPIDFFLRSLAHDLGERSVGVILSGMGSDGTGGLCAIREHGGAGFVQTPASARFDVMPRSAIDAGLADVVALAGDLPARITEHLQHARPPRPAAAVPPADTQAALPKIIGPPAGPPWAARRGRTGR